jgi:hypothetical protein
VLSITLSSALATGQIVVEEMAVSVERQRS